MTCYRDCLIVRERPHEWRCYKVKYDEYKMTHELVFVFQAQTLNAAKRVIETHGYMF